MSGWRQVIPLRRPSMWIRGMGDPQTGQVAYGRSCAHEFDQSCGAAGFALNDA